jgi:hypothetical protein
VIEGKKQPLDPLPHVGPLTNVRHVRAELARVYRDARTGEIDTRDASRLAFILTALYRVIEGSEIERRLEKLEETIDRDRR